MSIQALMPLSDYTDICNEVRSKTNSEEAIKSGELAGKIGEVYTAGYGEGEKEGFIQGSADGREIGYGQGYANGYSAGEKDGYNEGHEQGFADGKTDGINEGKQAQYDLFWDSFQAKGKPINYATRFQNWQMGWTEVDAIYNPKYDFIHSSSPNGTFRECYIKDIIKDNYFDYQTSATTLAYTFYYATRMENARTLHVREDTKYTSAFTGCGNLKEIRFAGTIGQNGLSFAQSTKLSKESHISVVEHLSATASGLTVTLSKAAVNKAFETSNGANDGSTSTEWITLVASKSNWTISLA